MWMDVLKHPSEARHSENAQTNTASLSHTLEYTALSFLANLRITAVLQTDSLLPLLLVNTHTHLASLPGSLMHCNQEQDCNLQMKRYQELTLPVTYFGRSPTRLQRTPEVPGGGQLARKAHNDLTMNG